MHYQVPQFIEVEDKIFGPLTLKQFIYIAGGGGLCLIFFSLLPFFLFIMLSIPVMVLSVGLAFYKVNGRPLIIVLEHAFGYTLRHKLYLWKPRQFKPSPPGKTPEQATSQQAMAGVPKLSESKLKDLAWSLNIKDRSNMGVSQTPARTGYEI